MTVQGVEGFLYWLNLAFPLVLPVWCFAFGLGAGSSFVWLIGRLNRRAS